MITTAQDYYKELMLLLNDERDRLEREILRGVPPDQYSTKIALYLFLLAIIEEATAINKKAINA